MGDFVQGDFVRGILSQESLSRGILSVGFCPGGFCPGGFCPRTEQIKGDSLSYRVIKYNGFNTYQCQHHCQISLVCFNSQPGLLPTSF